LNRRNVITVFPLCYDKQPGIKFIFPEMSLKFFKKKSKPEKKLYLPLSRGEGAGGVRFIYSGDEINKTEQKFKPENKPYLPSPGWRGIRGRG